MENGFVLKGLGKMGDLRISCTCNGNVLRSLLVKDMKYEPRVKNTTINSFSTWNLTFDTIHFHSNHGTGSQTIVHAAYY